MKAIAVHGRGILVILVNLIVTLRRRKDDADDWTKGWQCVPRGVVTGMMTRRAMLLGQEVDMACHAFDSDDDWTSQITWRSEWPWDDNWDHGLTWHASCSSGSFPSQIPLRLLLRPCRETGVGEMTPESLLKLRTERCTVGCPVLDRFLAGGISCNSLTELVAESGCGKTQFCLQLVLSAQLPPSHGGLSASSLYIHTEFPFPFRRLRQLSTSFVSSHSDIFTSSNSYDPCDKVFVQDVYCADEMLDIMPKIELFLQVNSKSQFPVRLIVIDSIAALFRSEFENTGFDLKRRSSLFFKISGNLKSLASRFGLAVVLTNQVVDLISGAAEGVNGIRVGNLSSLSSSGRRVCAALGIAWANCVNSRLFMSRNEEVVVGRSSLADEEGGAYQQSKSRRRLSVVFAPHLPESSCEFVITREGVFGVEM
ncbi:DNA repair protein XRCC3 homolog [Prosopis cineraria]|uniref:DNA repair protein XRCC3 homolog n=1 Tax=Prosopis cineraria TaxID=364024 RepID=UPI00241097C0|nr:DNA repair protein XRCC3 homolog [Prosopis cineraria]